MASDVEELDLEIGEQVTREVELPVDEERAWEAISGQEMLERWLADEVEMEPVEGSPAVFTVDGEERPGRVEHVVEGRELAFSWEREPGDESIVRFELVPCVSGTRVLVTETRLRTGAPTALASAWRSPLARLAATGSLAAA
jgi:uncharacterized protein YndB with AHSA1/START domain